MSRSNIESFVAIYLHSRRFERLTRDVFQLVEETATYLDGPGRAESKKLDRAAAVVYSGESLRLTTRLMKCTAWILAMRAVKEGESALAQMLMTVRRPLVTESVDVMPAIPTRLWQLILASRALEKDVVRLDERFQVAVFGEKRAG